VTEAVEVAMITSAAPTAAALVSLMVTLRHTSKLDHIIVLTNSTLSAARERITALEESLKRATPTTPR
jgi:hypothetical protein